MMNTIRFNEQQMTIANEETFAVDHIVRANQNIDYANKAFRGSGLEEKKYLN